MQIFIKITTEAEEFKKLNKLNYSLMSNADLYNFSTDFFQFKLICIKNDDSSLVNFFWKGSHDTASLGLQGEISKEEGIYIDVGSHQDYSRSSVCYLIKKTLLFLLSRVQ